MQIVQQTFGNFKVAIVFTFIAVIFRIPIFVIGLALAILTWPIGVVIAIAANILYIFVFAIFFPFNLLYYIFRFDEYGFKRYCRSFETGFKDVKPGFPNLPKSVNEMASWTFKGY